MSQMARSAAVFLISSPTVQSIIDSGLYKVTGPESVTAACIRAAEALARVVEQEKPAGMAAKLASEFFACCAGRVLLGATNGDFERLARNSLQQAAQIGSQLSSHDFDAEPTVAPVAPTPLPEVPATKGAGDDGGSPSAVVQPTPASTQAEAVTRPVLEAEKSSGPVVEPTLAAGQVDAPSRPSASPTVEPAPESPPAPSEPAAEKLNDKPVTNPADVPVEELEKHGIPAKLIEVLVAAGLPTAKAVRERDTQKQIDDLTDIGPAIRKKILAAIDEAIA